MIINAENGYQDHFLLYKGVPIDNVMQANMETGEIIIVETELSSDGCLYNYEEVKYRCDPNNLSISWVILYDSFFGGMFFVRADKNKEFTRLL